jgi:hypothetical protein
MRTEVKTLVSVLVLEVELKLSNIAPIRCICQSKMDTFLLVYLLKKLINYELSPLYKLKIYIATVRVYIF